MAEGKLTIKQEKFCNKYLECGNASEAYRFAYDCSRMTDNVISVKASQLLSNGKVTVRVKQKQRQGYVKGKAETTARLQRGSKNYNEVTTREKQPQARIIFARHYARVRETIELTKHFYRYI